MTVETFVSALFEIEVNAHIAHLQTKSYAEHKALKHLYEDIVDLKDRFVETYQGKYEIIKGYSDFKVREGLNFPAYLDTFIDSFDEYRNEIKNSSLQQIIDDINELLMTTNYKLKNLS